MTDDGPWDEGQPGVMRLPSGRLVRGRGLRQATPDGPEPTLGLYLLGKPPPAFAWETVWLPWRDFWLPTDREAARGILAEIWRRTATDRVELACAGGHGRTGTAMACLAVLDGVRADEAIAFVRRHYHPRAVETPWQERYVARFRGA